MTKPMENDLRLNHETQPISGGIELHAHISGSIDAGSICDLIYHNGLHTTNREQINSITETFGISLADAIANEPILTRGNFARYYECPPDGRNRFEEVMQRFYLTSYLLRFPGMKSQVGEIVSRTFNQQGVSYVEWRVDPFSSTQHETADEALEKLFEYYAGMRKVDLDSRFVLSIARNRFRNSEGIDYGKVKFIATQTEALLNSGKGLPIVGIDVAGAEVVPISTFRDLFDLAKSYGLGIVPHVGEGTNPTLEESLEDIDTTLVLSPKRLGHAIAAYMSLDEYLGKRDSHEETYDSSRVARLRAKQEEVLQRIKENGALIEVCPTSNLSAHLGLNSYESHPIDRLVEMDIPFVICSDDPGIFGKSLQEEIDCITKAKGLSKARIIENAQKAVS